MRDRNHDDDEITAVVRDAEKFVALGDVELSTWIEREGSVATAATVRRFLSVALRMDQRSNARVKVRQQFEDTYAMDVCVRAAARIQNAMPTR